MAEPFKNQVNSELIANVGSSIQQNWSDFDVEGFVSLATKDLEKYELKERCFRMVEAFEVYLPKDYLITADILLKSLHPETEESGFTEKGIDDQKGLHGWAIMAVQEYVGRNGLDHLGVSLNLLKEMTKRLTSEFGIRYFIEAYQLEVLKTMQVWAKDPNEHVRRLVSEGTRPRLPWGMQLKRFIKDPSPLLPLLDVLKDDPSEYVRRSVANNLNDISKDHPGIVVKIARSWMKGADQNRVKLIKHALRTLIKKGDPDALAVIGFGKAELSDVDFSLSANQLKIGQKIELELSLKSSIDETQSILVDYLVHYVKANGKQSAKVFKWRTLELPAKSEKRIKKTHDFKNVSVRKHYPGTHRIEVQVNGVPCVYKDFDLKNS